jgi:hypothetical protein
MAYECAGRVRHDKWSRRSFMQATVAGVATGVMASTLPRRAAAADGLRSIGLGVSEINAHFADCERRFRAMVSAHFV